MNLVTRPIRKFLFYLWGSAASIFPLSGWECISVNWLNYFSCQNAQLVVMPLAAVILHFYRFNKSIFSKLPELGDTIFIVLRKQRLIFLHWYHHITVFVYCWYSYGHPVATGAFTFLSLSSCYRDNHFIFRLHLQITVSKPVTKLGIYIVHCCCCCWKRFKRIWLQLQLVFIINPQSSQNK